MEINAWVITSIFCKLLIYGGAAMAVGGILTTLMVSRQSVPPGQGITPIAAALLLGIAAAVANFFVQVGNFADAGLTGMFDRTLGEILWQSQVGTAAVFQVTGFLVALAIVVILYILSRGGNPTAQPPPVQSKGLPRLLTVAAIVAGLAITYASTLAGHSVDCGLIGSAAILLHTFAVFWWMGSLYPLWRATFVLEPQALTRVMVRFGTVAIAFVAVVISAGGVLLWLMVDAPRDIIFTRHGQLLGLKLVFVCAILGLAARHKWRLVPLVQQANDGSARLRRSIAWEMVVAAIILLLTATLSTAVSPSHGGQGA
jgi:copper resistance protein D